MSKRHRQSFVWDHFKESGDSQVQCSECRLTMSYNNTTTTVKRHLETKHPYCMTASTSDTHC